MSTPLSALQNLHDLEALASSRMLPGLRDHVEGGAGDQWSLAENIRAFQRHTIVPRMAQGIDVPDTGTSLLGSALSMPVIAAPSGGHGAFADEAECATVRGASTAGTMIALSTWSTVPLEEVAALSGDVWFQLYIPADEGLSRSLIDRARHAGYRAIVVTLDVPVPSNRELNIRNSFAWPAHLPHGNFGTSAPVEMKRNLGWNDVTFVAERSGLPVIVKGILHPSDAADALAAGATGIWASNHGGRQLDGAPSALTMLPQIRDRIGASPPVILDGGVRRGQDIFRAIALGADAVAIGRPVLHGLTCAGAEGVGWMFARLREELAMAMHLAGAPDVDAIRDALVL